MRVATSRSRKAFRRAENRRQWAEALEPRLLLSAITEYGPVADWVSGLAQDSSGNIWYAVDGGAIGVLDASNGTITPGGSSGNINYGITVGPNDNVFVAASGTIAVFDSSGAAIDSFPTGPWTPGGTDGPRIALAITTGADGMIYFTAVGDTSVDGSGNLLMQGWIGQIDPAEVNSGTHTINYTATDTAGHFPQYITAAADGNVYGVMSTVSTLSSGMPNNTDVFQLTPGGALNYYHVPDADALVTGIATAADGSVWLSTAEGDPGQFAVQAADNAVQMTVSGTAATFTDYALDAATGSSPGASAITVGTDGLVYIGEYLTNDLAQLDPGTGAITTYAFPSASAYPSQAITTPDGHIWMAERYIQQIAEFTPSTGPSTGSITTLGTSLNLGVGDPFSGPIGTFTTTLGALPTTAFTVTIDWGDGSGTTAGTVTYDSGSATYTVSGDHTYAANADYNITATVTTTGAPAATIDSVAHVGPVLQVNPYDFTQQENVEYSGAVATFTLRRPLSGNTTAVINWGDGVTDYGAIAPDGSGGYVVLGTHTYVDAGTYAVGVSVLDGADTANAVSTATITPTPLDVSSGSLTSIWRIALGTVATFTADVDATASDFSATVNWGDGRTSQGIVIADPNQPGHFYVIGVHFYFNRGTYNTQTTVTNTVTGQVDAAYTSVTI